MARFLACLLLLGCGSGSASSNGSGSAGKGSGSGSSAPAPKKTTGFSASLSSELGSGGSGSAETKPPPDPKPPDPPKGSAVAKGSDTKGSDSKGSDSKVVEPKPPEPKPPDVKVATGSGSGSAKLEPPKPPPTKMTPELLAIKFELLPNWERDVAEPATFSLAVKLPKSNETKTFIFHYGYEDASAPVDRAEYMKWLAAQHLLDVTTERQRGAAWYLENKTAFRYLINYGGKRLICYGSQYRDTTHDPMGDLRDEVLLQAKKICESLSL